MIVCTTTLALGARELASRGAIVARLAAVEELAGLNVLCSDKTGTLTLNKMVIQDKPGASPRFRVKKKKRNDLSSSSLNASSPSPTKVEVEVRDDIKGLLRLAALAAKWREPPTDALDTMVLGAADLKELDENGWEQVEYHPFDASVKMTRAVVRAPSGFAEQEDDDDGGGGSGGNGKGGEARKYFGVAKGAAHALAALLPDDEAKDAVVSKMDEIIERLAERGTRAMVIARTSLVADPAQIDVGDVDGDGDGGDDDGGDKKGSKEGRSRSPRGGSGAAAAVWRIAGILSFLDPPRPVRWKYGYFFRSN